MDKLEPFQRVKIGGSILQFLNEFNKDVSPSSHEILHGEFTFYRDEDWPEGEYVTVLPKLSKHDVEREGWRKLNSDVEKQGIYNFTKTSNSVTPFIYDLTLLLNDKAIITERAFKEARPITVFMGSCRNIAQFRYLTRKFLNIK